MSGERITRRQKDISRLLREKKQIRKVDVKRRIKKKCGKNNAEEGD